MDEMEICYEVCDEMERKLKSYGLNAKKRKPFKSTCRQKCRSAGVPKIFVYPDEFSF